MSAPKDRSPRQGVQRRGTPENAPDGLRGLLARRVADWEIKPPDPRLAKLQMPFWNLVMDHYFRMDIEGWHRLPEPPTLVVGVHAGGMIPIDAFMLGFAWYRRFGERRPMHGFAHDALIAMPGLGDYIKASGGLPASRETITAALDCGHDALLMPGGEVEALRPWTERDQVQFGGRRGYVKQAISSQVPIVPVAISGGADTVFILARGKRVAKALGLDKLARVNALPLTLGFPFGIVPGFVPQLSLPAKIRMEFLEPVAVGDDPDRVHDDGCVSRLAAEVETRLQEAMDRLARRRSFPVFG